MIASTSHLSENTGVFERVPPDGIETFNKLGINAEHIYLLPRPFRNIVTTDILNPTTNTSHFTEDQFRDMVQVRADTELARGTKRESRGLTGEFITNHGQVLGMTLANRDLVRQMIDAETARGAEFAREFEQNRELLERYQDLRKYGVPADEIVNYYEILTAEEADRFYEQYFGEVVRQVSVDDQAYFKAGAEIYSLPNTLFDEDLRGRSGDLNTLFDGSVLLVAKRVRADLAKRAVMFDRLKDTETIAAHKHKIEAAFEAIQKEKSKKQYEALPKKRITIGDGTERIDVELPDVVAGRMEEERGRWRKRLAREYDSAVAGGPNPTVEQRIGGGWLTALEHVVNTFESEHILADVFADAHGQELIRQLRSQFTGIYDRVNQDIAHKRLSFSTIARYRFQENVPLRNTIVEMINIGQTRLRDRINELANQHMEGLPGLEALGRDLAILNEIRPVIYRDDLHFLPGYEMDNYTHGWGLTDKGFLFQDEYRPFEDGLPPAQEEWSSARRDASQTPTDVSILTRRKDSAGKFLLGLLRDLPRRIFSRRKPR